MSGGGYQPTMRLSRIVSWYMGVLDFFFEHYRIVHHQFRLVQFVYPKVRIPNSQTHPLNQLWTNVFWVMFYAFCFVFYWFLRDLFGKLREIRLNNFKALNGKLTKPPKKGCCFIIVWMRLGKILRMGKHVFPHILVPSKNLGVSRSHYLFPWLGLYIDHETMVPRNLMAAHHLPC
jgi:hypothetical protein